VILLLLTLAFGLTGYLLPWDNKAYWGTVVTAQILGSIPVFGSTLTHLLGAQNGIGVLTFARFYTLHTVLLPLIIVLMITIHIYLVRRHGITPAFREEKKNRRFYPKQAFRDTVAVFVAFTMLFLAAAFLHAPLGRLADPTDTTYIPRPEWYFLFLFELLKIFKGSLEVVGTAVLPTVAVIALFVIPFARGARFLPSNRKLTATAFVLGGFGIWAALTGATLISGPRHGKLLSADSSVREWAAIPPEQIAGMGYFRAWGCGSCHNLINGPIKAGPNLSATAVHHRKEWLVRHFTEKKQPGSDLTEQHPSLPQLNALSLFLTDMKPDSAARLQKVPAQFTKGAQVYVTSACASCHKVNGAGGGIGPPLNGLFDRRTKEWVEAHFADPQKLSPGSIMPPYHFKPEDRDALMLYLAALPD
jgi:ubiquinol-cytochrome c reductase cytochrome b subunit